jgi:amino acid transporter
MSTTPSAAQPGLVRVLGPILATALVVGTVIGSGVFKKPQVVAENVPYFGLAALAWVLGGVLVLLGALSLAEVAILYPRAGGNYVFLREGYGRLAGFLWGWVEFWIIRSASIAALAAVFSESLHDVLRNPAFQQVTSLRLGERPLGYWPQQWLTVAVIIGLALVNVRGVRWGGVLQLFITLVKIGSLLGILALPFLMAALSGPGDATPRPDPSLLTPVLPASLAALSFAGLGTAMLGVQWAYHGWMNIAAIAEEVRRPQRNIPIALLGGVAIIIFLYLGANLAYYLILPRDEMAALKGTTVAAEFSLRLLGPIGGAAAAAAVMCSVFGALNGNLMVGPRLLYAMGDDGLAPRVLRAVHPRYHTPALATLVMAGWSCLLVLAGAYLTQNRLPVLELGGVTLDVNVPPGKALFDVLTDFAMFGAVIFETMAVATIFVFRRRFPDVARPYRCPGYPLVPAVYVMVLSLVVASTVWSQRIESLVGTVFIALGATLYGAFLRGSATGKAMALAPEGQISPPGA